MKVVSFRFPPKLKNYFDQSGAFCQLPGNEQEVIFKFGGWIKQRIILRKLIFFFIQKLAFKQL